MALKIAMITPSVSRAAGGIFEIERRVSQEVQKRSDFEVGVFGLRDATTTADLATWEPLKPVVCNIAGPRAFGWSPSLQKEVRAWAPDLVHLHALWMYPSVVTGRWRRQTKRPTLITANGMLDAWALRNSRWKKRLAYWLFERNNLASASCIQVNSRSEEESVRALGLDNPVALIPNGVDLPAPEQLQAREVRRPAKGQNNLLLYLGRIHPKKGLVPLLNAWSSFRGTQPAWTLAVAGWDQGGHEEALKSQASELNIPWRNHPGADMDFSSGSPGSLVFLGPRYEAEKDILLRACDAFVLPSFSEGLPMAVLEAWSYGKPVMMTPMCNLPEGYALTAAIRVEPEDESLRQGLQTLMSMTEGERKDMGARGRALVEIRFTWPWVASELTDVYKWLIGGGHQPACVSIV